MEEIISYRNRSFTKQDIAAIRGVIASHPAGSRRFISQEVCRELNWRQANGVLKDMVCRSFLLLLEAKCLIKLPPRKQTPLNPLARRRNPLKVAIDQTLLESSLKDLLPIRLELVRRTPLEKVFNSLVHEHHYLGYTQPVGEHLKYIAFSHNRPIACLAWSSAPWYIGARDRFIGWSRKTREKNLHLIANNTRFLILPWVRSSCLASCLLALSRRRLSQDWRRVYGHTIHLVETFVDLTRFPGTSYKADNWVRVGETTGRGKLSPSNKPVLSKKMIFVYPLSKNFRGQLCHDV